MCEVGSITDEIISAVKDLEEQTDRYRKLAVFLASSEQVKLVVSPAGIDYIANRLRIFIAQSHSTARAMRKLAGSLGIEVPHPED